MPFNTKRDQAWQEAIDTEGGDVMPNLVIATNLTPTGRKRYAEALRVVLMMAAENSCSCESGGDHGHDVDCWVFLNRKSIDLVELLRRELAK